MYSILRHWSLVELKMQGCEAEFQQNQCGIMSWDEQDQWRCSPFSTAGLKKAGEIHSSLCLCVLHCLLKVHNNPAGNGGTMLWRYMGNSPSTSPPFFAYCLVIYGGMRTINPFPVLPCCVSCSCLLLLYLISRTISPANHRLTETVRHSLWKNC